MTVQPIPIAVYEAEGGIGQLELVDLVPPFALTGGLWACQRFRDLIAQGKLTRTRAGIERWLVSEGEITRNRRQTMFDQAMALLHGRPLEEAEAAFTEAYETHLRGDPGVAATRLVLHGLALGCGSVRLLDLPEPGARIALDILEWGAENPSPG